MNAAVLDMLMKLFANAETGPKALALVEKILDFVLAHPELIDRIVDRFLPSATQPTLAARALNLKNVNS